jgi:hypothetical protein
MKMNPNLRFEESDINLYADRYNYQIDENDIIALKPEIQSRGYLTKEDLFKIAYWKAPRSSGHIKKNSDDYIAEITRFAFSTNCERAKIQTLTNLDGVNWPTASVILHLYDSADYPIIDFRALWSISVNVPQQYKCIFWWEYVAYCRVVANRNHVSMRTMDRALWQYSKENQK